MAEIHREIDALNERRAALAAEDAQHELTAVDAELEAAHRERVEVDRKAEFGKTLAETEAERLAPPGVPPERIIDVVQAGLDERRV